MADDNSAITGGSGKFSTRLSGWLFRYHRWFGIVSCVAVVLWGASGVMHPIMSRINPTPVNMQPPQAVTALHGALTPAQVLARAGIADVSGLRVVAWDGGTYYQASFSAQAQRRYFEVNSGAELAEGDARYAEYLARHFTGDAQSKVRGVSLVTQFDDDYLDINRLLPVYRVDLERADGLRAYIETSPPRVSALVDDRKALLGYLFRYMHNWDFLRTADGLRTLLISAFLAVALLSAASGIWMYGFMWKRGTLQLHHLPLRRWHRTVGILVSLSALLFVVSAEWHLLGSKRRTVSPMLENNIPASQLGLPDSLRHGSWSQIGLAQVDGQAVYRLLPLRHKSATAMSGGEHDHSAKPQEKSMQQTLYVDSQSGAVLEEGARKHAVQLAGRFSGLPADKVANVALVSRFEGEYGFLNKRLPVWRVEYATPDRLSYYVETATGALATVVRDADRAEGWSFSYLHKFHWLDFAGKDVRDFVMGLFGLGNLAVALLGLWMFTRRYRKSRARATITEDRQ